jgi:hypothetical protein
MKKRTSVIWRLESEKFRQLVADSNLYGQILSFFGLKNKGGNNRTLKKRIKEEGIDDSHIKNYNYNQNRIVGKPLNEILVKNSTCSNRHSLKRRLISNGLLKNVCYICGLPPIWNKEKLILILDHINGDSLDYRIENLRLLCPNCNSQTETFCGRVKKRNYNCKKCGKEIKGEGKTDLCHTCLIERQKFLPPIRKFEIDKEKLRKLVWEKPVTKIAVDFNVSGNAIKKRCKLYNIPVPSRGYWTKKLYGKI